MLQASIQLKGRSFCLVAVLVAPFYALAQNQSELVSVQQYLELIDQEEDKNGLTSPDLVEPLTALGLQYVEQQNHGLAADAFHKARQILRVNEGFDTLQELPLLAHLVRAEEARGNFAEAWELEQALLTLAENNVGQLETLSIWRELSQKRLELRERHRTGEIPPQIQLGCYYSKKSFIQTAGMVRDTNSSVLDARVNCTSGDRRTVQLALLVEARNYQIFAVETLLQNDRYSSDEMQQQLTEFFRINHSLQARGLGYGDPPLAQLMARLLSWDAQDTASKVRRAEISLQLADMNVLRAHEYRLYTGFDATREQYLQSYEMLKNANLSEQQLDEIFSPTLPVMLPSFAPNPLAKVTEAEATGYIDISFEITSKGKTRRVRTVGTGGKVERSDQRELQRFIGLSIFRPRMIEGQVLDSAPVVVRYYLGANQQGK